LVLANDLDDLDEAEGDPQPAQGHELVIVDLRHATIMPPPWPQHRAAGLASPSADSTGLMLLRGSRVSELQRPGRTFLAGEMTGCCGLRPTEALSVVVLK
jgi:hypothetical protein